MKKTSISVMVKATLFLTLFFCSPDVSAQNLALGKATSATNSYSSSYLPANANDNNLSTSWASAVLGSSLTVNLVSNYAINNLILHLSALTGSYTIDIYNGTTWVTVVTIVGDGYSSPDVAYNFATVTGNQLRFTLQGFNNTAPYGGLKEIEIYAATDVSANNLTVYNNSTFYNNAAFSKGITAQGNVLIGKTSQANSSYKLDVNGKARANEVVVNTTGADFVFNDNYKLRPLSEVEEFIQANNHLPEIDPAALMQSNGVSIGQLQTQLLQKIEELTLYMIEQQKEIEKLKLENRKLFTLIK